MENLSVFMQGEEKGFVKMFGEIGGFGMVVICVDIIEKLFNSFLIEKKDKDIFIIFKGKQFLQFVLEDLKLLVLMVEWE